MLRKWIAPMASLALLAGLGTASMARAADAPTTVPAGKATISIKVVDADGKAVAGATVDLMPPPKRAKGAAPAAAGPAGATAQPMAADPATPTDPANPTPPKRVRAKPLQTTTTGADGTASFKGVADGTYYVRAHLTGSGNGREKVTVADDKDVTVTVTLKKPA